MGWYGFYGLIPSNEAYLRISCHKINSKNTNRVMSGKNKIREKSKKILDRKM
jgi:hypothetical protein